MKKIILIISGIMVFATVAMGCSNNNVKTEEELINKANALIEEKYEIEIHKDDYKYDLGEVLSDNQFGNIQDGKFPKEVFLRAVNKDKPSSGEVFNYSIEFNTETDEIISSECEIY